MSVADALRRTIALVDSSESAAYSSHSAEEIGQSLRVALRAVENGAWLNAASLALLFAPTGSIQETALANAWGEEFLALSEVVDAFLARKHSPDGNGGAS